MSSASPVHEKEISRNTTIQAIRGKRTKIDAKSRYHFHVTAATEIEVTFDLNKKAMKAINATIYDDAIRLFYLLYVSPDESYTVAGESPSTEACLFVMGTDGSKHEIIVQSGDIFTVIATPGHIYCIRSENDDLAKVEHFNLTLNQDCTMIVNPLPGRQYNITIPMEVTESKFSNTTPSYIHINCFHI